MKNEFKPYKINYLLLNNTGFSPHINRGSSHLTQWYKAGDEPVKDDILFEDSEFPALVLSTERIYNKQEIREIKIKKLMK